MFLTRRPSALEIEKFINQSGSLPLSYNQIGIARENPRGFNIDEASAVIGRGEKAFERARMALVDWRHFNLGWVEVFPGDVRIEAGAVVVVLIRHLRL